MTDLTCRGGGEKVEYIELEKHATFAKDGIGTEFCYERDRQERFWLVSRQDIKEEWDV